MTMPANPIPRLVDGELRLYTGDGPDDWQYPDDTPQRGVYADGTRSLNAPMGPLGGEQRGEVKP